MAIHKKKMRYSAPPSQASTLDQWLAQRPPEPSVPSMASMAPPSHSHTVTSNIIFDNATSDNVPMDATTQPAPPPTTIHPIEFSNTTSDVHHVDIVGTTHYSIDDSKPFRQPPPPINAPYTSAALPPPPPPPQQLQTQSNTDTHPATTAIVAVEPRSVTTLVPRVSFPVVHSMDGAFEWPSFMMDESTSGNSSTLQRVADATSADVVLSLTTLPLDALPGLTIGNSRYLNSCF